MSNGNGDGGIELNDFALISVIALLLVGVVIAAVFYLAPPEHLRIPELDPAVRVARAADFPIGGSRVVHWGDQVILVVRTADDAYAAVQGVSPRDGCILRWDLGAYRVVSPCSYEVYSLRGETVVGLSSTPLRQYRVMLRSGDVYVVG